jgi:hypothetical protein
MKLTDLQEAKYYRSGFYSDWANSKISKVTQRACTAYDGINRPEADSDITLSEEYQTAYQQFVHAFGETLDVFDKSNEHLFQKHFTPDRTRTHHYWMIDDEHGLHLFKHTSSKNKFAEKVGACVHYIPKDRFPA